MACFLLADIDECTLGSDDCNCGGFATCTEICTDMDPTTSGGVFYECSCSAGFIVGLDRRTCEGSRWASTKCNQQLLALSSCCFSEYFFFSSHLQIMMNVLIPAQTYVNVMQPTHSVRNPATIRTDPTHAVAIQASSWTSTVWTV